MTTILADAKLGVMVSDSKLNDGNRVWSARKVYRIRGALVGCAGAVVEAAFFRDWYAAGATDPINFPFKRSSALVLEKSGLYLFDESTIELTKVPSGREAIGSGGQGAICAYEALGWKEPAKAVRVACKHDLFSGGSIRTFKL